MLEWNPLSQIEDLDRLVKESHDHPILIFKHSTRCNVSAINKMRLETRWLPDLNILKSYLLNIFFNRELSDAVSIKFVVEHESPQILILDQGQCIYHASHFDISIESIQNLLSTHLSES